MKRTWAKQQQAARLDEVEGYTPPSSSSSSSSPRAQTAGAKSAIRSQLAGLRQRAAIRSTKASSSSQSTCSSVELEEEEEEHNVWEDEEDAKAVQDQSSVSFDLTWTFTDDDHAEENTRDLADECAVPRSEDGAVGRGSSGCNPESPRSPPPPPPPGSRRKFVSHSGTRDQVYDQLAGLKRKAAMAHA